MVAAGLTAATPHMISASINALSRLLFEFKGESSFHSPHTPLHHPPISYFSVRLFLDSIASYLSPLSIAWPLLPDQLSLVSALRSLACSLTPRLHLNLHNLGTSSNNNRIPSIEKSRNRQIRPRFRKSSNSSSTPRRNNPTPTSSSPSFTRFGTRS